MKLTKKILFLLGTCVIIILFLNTSTNNIKNEWGFFGHRRINRMAIFTLPQEMMPFYRHHLEYITDHAVDPDKRRYATKHEAVRHYIDIDHWGTFPFPEVPREFTEALIRYGEIQLISHSDDTIRMTANSILNSEPSQDTVLFSVSHPDLPLFLPLKEYKEFWRSSIMPQYYEDEWVAPIDITSELLGVDADKWKKIVVIDHFSEYGIVPYHLVKTQRKLQKAFERKDVKSILRISAEIGHYVGDAHVPLHTTENYNGAMTNQIGIHAFWESRLPELFADETYDYFVGRADYIPKKRPYFWKVVFDSHALLDSVMAIEKHLSLTYPSDQQYCYEERLERTVRTQCEAYATTYHKAMDGMVETRMRDAIHSIGSVWFTAWVDAGQPDLTKLLKDGFIEDAKVAEELDNAYQKGASKGRDHGSE